MASLKLILKYNLISTMIKENNRLHYTKKDKCQHNVNYQDYLSTHGEIAQCAIS